jgi:hypothetical protein
MSKFTEELVRIAKTQIGVCESGGNNKGPMIVEYQKATWLKPGAWPWCAAFVDWVIKNALTSKDVMKELGLKNATQVKNWRPQTAGAWDFDKWGKEHGFKILPETEKAKAGDLVTFDFSHIGIVIEDQIDENIITVEGNTNGRGERDSLSGDGVWKKTRNYKLIRTLIRKE